MRVKCNQLRFMEDFINSGCILFENREKCGKVYIGLQSRPQMKHSAMSKRIFIEGKVGKRWEIQGEADKISICFW